MQLKEFIDLQHGGNQAAFARHMGVDRQTVRKWIKAGWIYSSSTKKLYSPQRDVPDTEA